MSFHETRVASAVPRSFARLSVHVPTACSPQCLHVVYVQSMFAFVSPCASASLDTVPLGDCSVMARSPLRFTDETTATSAHSTARSAGTTTAECTAALCPAACRTTTVPVLHATSAPTAAQPLASSTARDALMVPNPNLCEWWSPAPFTPHEGSSGAFWNAARTKMCMTSLYVSPGFALSTSPATPAAMGAEALVPLNPCLHAAPAPAPAPPPLYAVVVIPAFPLSPLGADTISAAQSSL